MKTLLSLPLLIFYGAAFCQYPPTLGYVIELRLEDNKGAYTNFYPTLLEVQKDSTLQELGLRYDPEYQSLKLHGNGRLIINGVGFSMHNAQFEGEPRSGIEIELREDSPDSLKVILVYWKLGVKRAVVEEYMTYRRITDEMRPVSTRPKSPQDLYIRLNRPLELEEFTTLDQKTWNMGKLEAKVTVISFWFVACMPFVEDIPKFNQLVERYAKDSVAFVAFSMDQEESIQRFLAKVPFHYQIVPNARETANMLGVSAFPTHLIIDKEGTVRYLQEGYAPGISKQLGQVIDRLLGKAK